MTNLQIIICAAIVAFFISAVFRIAVIVIVYKMIKSLNEETQECYEYTTRYVNKYNREGEYGDKLAMLLQEMGANGWRVLELQNTHNQFYYIYFERKKQ